MISDLIFRIVKTKGKMLILLNVLVLVSVSADETRAQKGHLEGGIHAGIAMARLYERSKLHNDFYFRTVPDMGLMISYGIGRRLSLGVELNYVSISSQREGLLPLENAFPAGRFPTGSYAYFSDRLDLNYLEVPVLINRHMGCRLKLFCGIGPFIGFKLGALRRTTGSSFIYSDNVGNTAELVPVQPRQSLDQSRDVSNDIHAINLGGCERVGLSYMLGKGRIWTEVRYSFGMVDIWKKSPDADINQTDQLVLRVAYTIQL